MTSPRYQSLKSHGIGGDTTPLESLVGKVLAIQSMARTASQRYGAGLDINLDVLDDPTAGTLETSGVRVITYAGPVVRDLGRIMGEQSSYAFTPPLLVTVEHVGQALVVRDVD